MFPPVRTAGTETFGLPATDTRLIQKLRTMDPALRESILTTKETGK
ncbi:hypothetical protein ACFFGR_09390 [Arthrobacter liuii]|uniref:Uncharacterized protein n=1 Tax=Arthrobacter liuii TaxID=1476996 RepID=A0ABQ2APL3_9MICC|nr:hypothetical protein [Arthrobacter liuii]GGH93877.1 hypothetical protein GCM10007170_15770 [Arthrobacter liuii]